MKKYFIFCFLNCLIFQTHIFAQKADSASIQVFSIDFRTHTTTNISCDDFIVAFGQQLKTSIIENQDSLKMLSNFIKRVSLRKKEKDFDTRAKIILKNNTQNDVICLNYFDILINGRQVKSNKKFLKFLFSLIPPEHLHKMVQQ